jgi:hypothetical protein
MFGLIGAGAARSQTATWWKPAAVFAVFALLCVGGWLMWSNSHKSAPIGYVPPPPAPSIAPNPSPANSGSPTQQRKEQPAPISAPNNSPRNNNNLAPHSELAVNNNPRERDESFVERTIVPDAPSTNSSGDTRGGNWVREIMGKPLNEVQRVYVQAIGDSADSGTLLQQVRKRLTDSGKLQFSESEQADAALKISVRPASSRADDQRVIAIVRAVNANGYVVWPASRRGSSWRYVGRPDHIAEHVIADLTKSVAQARRRH